MTSISNNEPTTTLETNSVTVNFTVGNFVEAGQLIGGKSLGRLACGAEII
jgi:hypothetical protein